MDLGARQWVAQRGAESDRQGTGATVGHLVGQEGGRDSRVAVFEGNEGIEGAQADFTGTGGIGESYLGEGIGGAEGGVAEVGQACEQVAVRPESETGMARLGSAGKPRAEVALHEAHVHCPPLVLATQRHVRETVEAALVGVVGDLPVDEASIAAKANAAGAEAAQRKTDACLALTGVVNWIHVTGLPGHRRRGDVVRRMTRRQAFPRRACRNRARHNGRLPAR